MPIAEPMKELNKQTQNTSETVDKLVEDFVPFTTELDNAIKNGEGVQASVAKISKRILEQLALTKKLKEEEKLRASAVEAVQTALAVSSTKTTKAIVNETNATMGLAKAREEAIKAVKTALSVSSMPTMDTGLFSNFTKGFKDVAESQKQMFTQMRDIGAESFDRLKSSLTDFVMTGKLSFADLGTFVVRSMVDMLIGEAIKNALDGSLKMFKASSIKKALISLHEGAMKTFASIPFPLNLVAVGGALAFGAGIVNKMRGFEKGGRPPVGRASIVGEKGAELFVPDQAGTIVPNDRLGMGKEVTVNFNISTVDARGFNELLVNSRGVIVNLINSAVNEKGRMAVI